MIRRIEVISIGGVNIDICAIIPKFPGIDEEIEVVELQELPGGSAANYIVGIARLGMKAGFLQPGMRVPVETIGERAIGVVFPESVELRVASTAQPMRQRETSALKTAVLENGMEVLVPLFIREGELIRVEVATGKYLERVKGHERQ